MSRRTRSSAALAALLTLLAVAAAAQARPKIPPPPVMHTYEVRIAMSMESNFAFQNDPVGCNGRLPEGYDGQGREIMQMSSPRPVLVQTVYSKGYDPTVMRKDLKPSYSITGTSKRTGSMTQVVCEDHPPSNFEPCLGSFPVHDEMELSFYKGRFTISTNTVQDTHALIAGCGNSSFDWDGATARTGYVLTQTAQGPAPASKFKSNSFSLRAHTLDHCVPTDFGAASGSCTTTWDYKVNFRLVKQRKHHR
jgi:hypothetical protein